MTDVVGRLVELTEDEACIERRDGSLTRVTLTDVVTWKVVPDRPLRSRRASSASADKLTRITSRGWPAIESMALGEWELRTSRGFTGRANSVAVHGDPGMPFDDALRRVRDFYDQHERPALAQVVMGSDDEERFAAAGWEPMRSHRNGALVQVTDLRPVHAIDPEAVIAPTADDDWLSMYGRVEDPSAARAVLEGPDTVGFISIGNVAIGRVAVSGEWAGIGAVEVLPEHRRQGLARRIVGTAIAWAMGHGADKAYLQTMRDNTAALALYASFGFVDHHEYRYLQPSGAN